MHVPVLKTEVLLDSLFAARWSMSSAKIASCVEPYAVSTCWTYTPHFAYALRKDGCPETRTSDEAQ